MSGNVELSRWGFPIQSETKVLFAPSVFISGKIILRLESVQIMLACSCSALWMKYLSWLSSEIILEAGLDQRDATSARSTSFSLALPRASRQLRKRNDWTFQEMNQRSHNEATWLLDDFCLPAERRFASSGFMVVNTLRHFQWSFKHTVNNDLQVVISPHCRRMIYFVATNR